MPSGPNMNRLKCQRQKKSFVSIGMIGTFRYLGLDPSICLALDFRIRMKIYENFILNRDILEGMPHARQLMTTGVRMLPWFPGVGDGADYGAFGPQGPSASVAQRTGEVHGFFLKQRAKGIVYSFNLKKWYRYRIVSSVPQLKITLSWHRNLSITLLLQSLSCCELRAKGICRIRFLGSGNL